MQTNKQGKKLIALSILLTTTFGLVACGNSSTESSNSNNKDEITESSSSNNLQESSKPTTKEETKETTGKEETKGKTIMTFEGNDGSSSVLTFKNNKLVEEKSKIFFPYANETMSQKMTKEEYSAITEENKQSFKDKPGISYDIEFLPNDESNMIFTIDFTKVAIDDVAWLTEFTNETSPATAKSILEANGFKEVK